MLIGETEGHARRSRSICARSLGREDGPPPPVDLAAERRNGEFVRGLIGERRDHRLPRPVGRRACRGAGRDGAGRQASGATLDLPAGADAGWFCSARIRAAICWRSPTTDADAVWRGQGRGRAGAAARHDRRRRVDTGGRAAHIAGETGAAHEAWLPDYMAGSLKARAEREGCAWRWTRREIEQLDQGGTARRRGARSRICAATAITTPRTSSPRRSRGKTPRPAAPDGLPGAARAHGRRAARAWRCRPRPRDA